MNQSFSDAIQDVAEIMQFENWLRFYFLIEDAEGSLFMRIPEEAMGRIKNDYPHLHDLAEVLNNAPITYKSSCTAVCQHVASKLDGHKYREGIATKVFEDKRFQGEMEVFGLWAQSHEAQLDQTFTEFSTWRELFAEWKNSDKVRDYVEQLHSNTASVAGGNATVH